MNRRSFQKLVGARLLDSKALLKAKRYDAAYYVAGYAIECALKACIAKRTRLYDFPPKDTRDFYSHEMEKLLKLAGIEKSFQQERGNDAILAQHWDIVKDWKPGDRRYDLRGAKEAANAAKALLSAIEDRQHGVLQCLSKYC
jgi:HEPN domain-containing protein